MADASDLVQDAVDTAEESEGEKLFGGVFGEDNEEKDAKKRLAEKQKEKEMKKQKAPEQKEEALVEKSDEFKALKAELDQQKIVEEPAPKKAKKPAKKKADDTAIEKSGGEMLDRKKHREAIKKLVLSKAQKAAEEEHENESEVNDFLEKNVVEEFSEEDLLKESGTKEEGTKAVEMEKEKQNAAAAKSEFEEIQEASAKIKPDLSFLTDEEGNGFIGRKQNVYQKYGNEAALLIGRVFEQECKGKRISLDGLNPHVVFVCGARGSGKCLHGDSLLQLNDGRVLPIKELENETGKVLALNHDLKIEETEKIAFSKRAVQKILRVVFRTGKEIKLTPEHPLLTVNGWKPAEELQKGSRIATPRIAPFFGNNRMKECDVKLLAYLIAEGHLGTNFVLFSNSDNAIVEEFKANMEEFDAALEIKEHGKGSYRVVQKKRKIGTSHIVRNKKGQFTEEGFVVAQKSSIRQWIDSTGLYGKLSKEKFIPKEIMRLEKQQIALFLNRLFSCDGSIYRINKGKNWGVCYASTSEELIKQVQHLLLRFGIISMLRKKQTSCNGKKFASFELVAYGENVIKFISEIGFFGKKQEKQEIALQEMLALARNPNTDTIPIGVWNNYQPRNWKATARTLGYSPSSFHMAKHYAPSREKLLKIATVDENKGIQLLAQSDIYWDEITKIEEINEETEVFDIEVPNNHNFIANDIIVHNSYLLGIIAEELALKNPNVGIVVVDPVGVFWSMRQPNRDEKELETLKKWGMKPQGLENIKVFIPAGIKDKVPSNTYDAAFTLPPALLTAEDWCLTFGIDRFSPSGLLLEKCMFKVKHGYKSKDGKITKPKPDNYSLEDLIRCLDSDSEINSPEKGYKSDSIRALSSRFDAANTWGIFEARGTPLGELSRESQLTIIDTSFLDDNVSALVIGLLARRLLAARKMGTRKEAAQKLKDETVDQLLEVDIPPTWLFIDEAHTLIPSGNMKTPASSALIEYVKQGRQPGCSLVFATQQPSAIDTKVLSQLDIIVAHKLVFDDDVKAVFKRTPTIIPKQYKASNFIKTLPVGVAMTGDRREETTRAFILEVRPRMSQHEGREAVTTERQRGAMSKEQAKKMAVDMVYSKLQKSGFIESSVLSQAIQTLNAKFKQGISANEVLKELEKKGAAFDAKKSVLFIPGRKEQVDEEEIEEVEKEEDERAEREGRELPETKKEMKAAVLSAEELELAAFPVRVNEASARGIAESRLEKKLFGLLGSREKIKGIDLKFEPIFRLRYHVLTRINEFVSHECFINSVSGEFVHFHNGKFVESRGVSLLWNAPKEEIALLRRIDAAARLGRKVFANEEKEKSRALEALVEKGLVEKKQLKDDRVFLQLAHGVDLPPEPTHALLQSANSVPFVKTEVVSIEQKNFEKNDAAQLLEKMFDGIKVKKIDEIYRPVYEAKIEGDSKSRIIKIDAMTGAVL